MRKNGLIRKKFGQLIEYNMRNTFLEKPYTRYCRATIPRSFFQKIKIDHIPGSMVSILIACFHYMLSWGLLHYIETKLQTTCFYLEKQKQV